MYIYIYISYYMYVHANAMKYESTSYTFDFTQFYKCLDVCIYLLNTHWCKWTYILCMTLHMYL